MFSKIFWVYAGERAIKTVAQAAIAALGAGVVGLLQVDWINVSSIAALAGVVSLLTSLVNYKK